MPDDLECAVRAWIRKPIAAHATVTCHVDVSIARMPGENVAGSRDAHTRRPQAVHNFSAGYGIVLSKLLLSEKHKQNSVVLQLTSDVEQ